ncbi:MAG: hypothetical protein ABWK05_00455 [Pyrobaculum sp.]
MKANITKRKRASAFWYLWGMPSSLVWGTCKTAARSQLAGGAVSTADTRPAARKAEGLK